MASRFASFRGLHAFEIEAAEVEFVDGSHDDRGTESAPGPGGDAGARSGVLCHGMAYLVTSEEIAYLDHREKNGYLRLATEIFFDDGGAVEGLVYIATDQNEAFLGPASEVDITRHIATSRGPSGPNSEYLPELAKALRALGKDDAHVFAFEKHLDDVNSAFSSRNSAAKPA